MKNVTKNTLLLMGSIAVGVGVGLGTYFIVKNIVSGNESKPTKKEAVNLDVGAIIHQNKLNDLPKFVPISKTYTSKDDVKLDGVEAYFNIVEYKYNEKTFLGKEGLKLLNKRINERLPFGSEFFQLKSISFNNVNSLPRDENTIDGQYDPYTMELDIDLRKLIDNPFYSRWTLEDRVDWVFGVLLHEYGHHLANTYITSIRQNDVLNYNKSFIDSKKYNDVFMSYSNNDLFIVKNLPKKFINTWTNALNYDNTLYSQWEQELLEGNSFYTNVWEYRKPSQSFFYNLITNSTSKNMFDAANHPINNDLFRNLLSISNDIKLEKYGYLHNWNNSPKWIVNLKNAAEYSFGIDELLTRHLVSMNYIPNNAKNYFWIGNEQDIYINSFGVDVLLRNQININFNNSNQPFGSNGYIYQADNIFGGYIGGNQTRLIEPKNIELLQSYKTVFGSGKLISQIYMNNENNRHELKNGMFERKRLNEQDFNEIRIGGYIEEGSKIKKIILKLIDKKTNKFFEKEIAITTINSTPLKTKGDILDMSYIDGDNKKYKQYISEKINLTEILNQYNIEGISYWEDKNDDNEISKVNNVYSANINEIKDVNQHDIVVERPISTFRSSFEITLFKKNKLIGNINSGPESFYHDSHNKNIYKIVFENNKTRIVKEKNTV